MSTLGLSWKERVALWDTALSTVRAYFRSEGLSEVSTPIRVQAPSVEPFIEPITAPPRWLATSPELAMKRLLCRGSGSIFQIAHVFRSKEVGALHSEEFHLIEWYRDLPELSLLQADVEKIVARVFAAVRARLPSIAARERRAPTQWDTGKLVAMLRENPGTVKSLLQAVRESGDAAFEPGELRVDDVTFDDDREVRRLERWTEIFSRWSDDTLEVELRRRGAERAFHLEDFPPPLAAFAEVEGGVAKRFESYVEGIELANGYRELRDAAEYRRRFETVNAMRQRMGAQPLPIDQAFLQELDADGAGLPRAQGWLSVSSAYCCVSRAQLRWPMSLWCFRPNPRPEALSFAGILRFCGCIVRPIGSDPGGGRVRRVTEYSAGEQESSRVLVNAYAAVVEECKRLSALRTLCLYILPEVCTMRASMRRIFVLVALASFGIGGCAKIEARDRIREGNLLYSDARYEEAIAKYDEALELEPDGVTVLWNRACAAESVVLRLKDETENEEKLKKRKAHADVALADLQRWFNGLEMKTEEDQKAYEDHRLAVLSADVRCDDLVAHWVEKHKEDPKDEGLYTVIARTFEDTCGQPEKAEEWYVKRTADFPSSAKAWYSLAVRRFEALFPEPDSGLAFNQSIAPSQRIEIANDVIEKLEKATKFDPKYRDPYIWRAMAYTQRQFARVFQEPPESTEERLEAILAREDSMLAWKEQKAVCDIDDLPDCPRDVEPAELFANPGAFNGVELNLGGKVVGETVKEIDAAKNAWGFDVQIDETNRVAVQFTFMRPEPAEEGGEVPDISEHVKGQVEDWKSGGRVFFAGKLDAAGKNFSVQEKAPAACCPPAPISPEAAEQDRTQKAELTAQLEEEAAKAARKAKKRGRRG